LSSRLTLPADLSIPLVVPVAFFSILTGLFVIVSRKNAITQVLGYIVMENGIYTFGIALAVKQPLLVEFGILLDIFVGVFVMGITIFNINREFEHIDTDQLSHLRS
jgi:hydrogenase-4 component E